MAILKSLAATIMLVWFVGWIFLLGPLLGLSLLKEKHVMAGTLVLLFYAAPLVPISIYEYRRRYGN